MGSTTRGATDPDFRHSKQAYPHWPRAVRGASRELRSARVDASCWAWKLAQTARPIVWWPESQRLLVIKFEVLFLRLVEKARRSVTWWVLATLVCDRLLLVCMCVCVLWECVHIQQRLWWSPEAFCLVESHLLIWQYLKYKRVPQTTDYCFLVY